MSAPDRVMQERTLAYGQGRPALLAAAVRVVAERGLRNLTYRAVAHEAGVTHGLVTHHFGTRDALIHAALEYSLQSSIPAITSDPGSGRIESLFAGLAELVQGDPGTQAFQYELILEARRRPELLPHVEAIYAAYHEALRVELERAGIDSDDAFVHLVFSALDGLVFQQTALGRPDATRASLERLRELLTLLSNARQH
ncbi:TetR/AcrR family transcriptional regulator [Geodermatophilus sp. SYSU D00742]